MRSSSAICKFIHAPPLARVWLRTPISNILAIFAHRMHTLFSRKRANKEHPQTTFEAFNFHSVKNIFVYSLRLRRYWPFIVIDFPDIANYRLAEALLEVVFLSFPESWWMPAKGRNIWQIVWGNCQLVKFGLHNIKVSVITCSRNFALVNSKFWRICKKCFRELTQCLPLSEFPQTFLTNPSQLRIYPCKIPTVDHRNFDCVN
jgi:hypothetical protein